MNRKKMRGQCDHVNKGVYPSSSEVSLFLCFKLNFRINTVVFIGLGRNYAYMQDNRDSNQVFLLPNTLYHAR